MKKLLQNKAKIYDKWIQYMVHSFDDYLKEKAKEQD